MFQHPYLTWVYLSRSENRDLNQSDYYLTTKANADLFPKNHRSAYLNSSVYLHLSAYNEENEDDGESSADLRQQGLQSAIDL